MLDRLRSILVILLLSFPPALSAQEWRPPVETALSNPSVTALAETTDGYIWIGTRRGLNRYNGSNYMVWFQGEESLSSDRILSLCADSDNRLWVGTDAGINLIQDNAVVRRGEDFFYPVTRIVPYDQDHLLCSTSDGLQLYDKSTGEMTPLDQAPGAVYAQEIAVSPGGDIYVSGRKNRPVVTVYDTNLEKKTERVIAGVNSINSIAVGFEDCLFVGTDKGLKVLSLHTLEEDVSKSRLLAVACGVSAPDVLFVRRDEHSRQILACVANHGIYGLDSRAGEFRRLWPDLNLSGAVNAICLLTEGNLFLSTDRLSLLDKPRSDNRFTMHFSELADSDDAVQRIHRAENGVVVVQAMKKVFLANSLSGGYRDVTPRRDFNRITASLLDSEGNYWMVVDYGRLEEYSLGTGSISLKASYPLEDVRNLWLDSDGNVNYLEKGYVCTLSGGEIARTRISASLDGYWRPISLPDGGVWFLGPDKVYRFTRDRQFSELRLPRQVSSPNCIAVDESGEVWIGTYNSGIVRYNPTNGQEVDITMQDGLPDNSIRQIVPYSNGMWVSMRNNVAFIGRDGSITAFPVSNDAASSVTVNFVTGAGFRGTGDQIVFAGEEQLIEYFPQAAQISRKIPLNLDAVLVNNNPWKGSLDKMKLTHEENLIVYYYAPLDFRTGTQLNYAYMLEGHDRQWVQAGRSTRAFYSNLRPGKYRFMLKVQTPDGNWQEPVSLSELRIRQAWWASTAAKLLYLLFIVGALALLASLYVRGRENKERAEIAEQEKLLNAQLDRDKTEFFTHISHEYRTPLSMIYGPAIELSRSETLDEKDRHLVDMISRSAAKMLNLTGQVINFNKFSRNGERLVVMKTDLAVIVGSLWNDFTYMIEQKGLDFNSEVPGHMPVWCDRDKVDKILFNLLGNALKYTPEGGLVALKLDFIDAGQAETGYSLGKESGYAGRYARMAVYDTGIGIPDEKKARIFDLFERLESPDSAHVPDGFGVGLNYSMHLASIHKGTIRVSDNVPAGTVLTFVFPCDKEAYTEEERWSSSDEEIVSGSDRHPHVATGEADILVVEDNPELRAYIREILEKDFRVMTSSNGQEALDRLKTAVPDIVISDIMMPCRDGLQLLGDIKSSPEWCHLPVILLTARAEVSDKIAGLESGADAYISKPFDPRELVATVRSLIANRRRMQGILRDKTSEGVSEAIDGLSISSRDRGFLEKMYKIIDENLSDENFSVIELARMMNISRSGLFSKLKALTGESPQTFITNYRLNRAKQLLETHEFNISEVAYRVGYGTLNGLSRAFKAKFGVPPSSV